MCLFLCSTHATGCHLTPTSPLLLWVSTSWKSFFLAHHLCLPTCFSGEVHTFSRCGITTPSNMRPSSHQPQPAGALVRASCPPPTFQLPHQGEDVNTEGNVTTRASTWLGDFLFCNGKGEPAGLVYKSQRVKVRWLEKEASRSFSYSARHMQQAWQRPLCRPSGKELPPMESWALESS